MKINATTATNFFTKLNNVKNNNAARIGFKGDAPEGEKKTTFRDSGGRLYEVLPGGGYKYIEEPKKEAYTPRYSDSHASFINRYYDRDSQGGLVERRRPRRGDW